MARISLVKPDKARAIEDMLLMAARRGQIQEMVSVGHQRVLGRIMGAMPALCCTAEAHLLVMVL